VQGIGEFFHALGREAATLWDQISAWMVSIFDPQTGWQPKAIFGAILLWVIFWISKRGTKS